MHKDWVVYASVSLIEAQLVVGERVDPMLVDEPVEWSSWHAQEFCTIHIVPFRASGSPERRRSWCHEFGIAEHVRHWPFHRHVEVTAHEVDVKQLHVRVETLKERSGGVSFLGDHVV